MIDTFIFTRKTKWPKFVELMVWSLDMNKYEAGCAKVVLDILKIETEDLEVLCSAYINAEYDYQKVQEIIKKTGRVDSRTAISRMVGYGT